MSSQQAAVPDVRSIGQRIGDITRGMDLVPSQFAIIEADGIALQRNEKAVVRVMQNLSATAVAYSIRDGDDVSIDINNEPFFVMAACSGSNAGDGGSVNVSFSVGQVLIKAISGSTRVAVMEFELKGSD